jgi:hypothetical protein
MEGDRDPDNAFAGQLRESLRVKANSHYLVSVKEVEPESNVAHQQLPRLHQEVMLGISRSNSVSFVREYPQFIPNNLFYALAV